MSPVANAARGEAIAVLAGEPRRLCLTLGALAEIETALGLESAVELSERLRTPNARDLLAVLAALLRGGGEAACADSLGELRVDPREAAEAIAAAFTAAA